MENKKTIKRSDMIKLNKHITFRIFNQMSTVDRAEELNANFNKLEDKQKQEVNAWIDARTAKDESPSMWAQNLKCILVFKGGNK